MPQSYVVDLDKASALSVGGGDHVEIITDDANIAAAEAGDLVVYGELVGFALTNYDATRESIVISTQGGYEAEVVAKAAADNEAIHVGSWLYYDAADDEINRDATNGVPIGQALAAVTAGETATIGIVLRPVPPSYA